MTRSGRDAQPPLPSSQPSVGTTGQRRSRPARRLPAFVAYSLGTIAGAIATPILVGSLIAIGIFYANLVAGTDLQNGPIVSTLVVLVLASPFVGAVLGGGFVAWKRRANRVPNDLRGESVESARR